MPKNILLIDDSALMRRVISDIINTSGKYTVSDIAKDGLEGLDLIVSNPYKFAAVILDINMPKMNGLELLEYLQKKRIRQKIIVVSTVAKKGAKETIEALELGAFDFITKPENYLETKSDKFRQKICQMLDAATEKQQYEPAKQNLKSVEPQIKIKETTTNVPRINKSYERITGGRDKLVAIACSTGGPKALQQIIPMLPKNLNAGVVLVQHMPKGFTASLANRLNDISAVDVKEAQHGDIIKHGVVYIAPGGMHMKIAVKGSVHVIELSEDPPVDGLRPCANIMYESISSSKFDKVVCAVLTGMGADGTKGIASMVGKTNMHVIAQDEDSSVVYGMPRAIVQSGLADEVVSLSQVANSIIKNVGVS